MSNSIKCPVCQTWNEDQDYCNNCGKLLNFEIRRKQEREEKKQAELNRPKDKIDLFLEKIKKSDKTLDKILYFTLQSIWFLLIALASVGLAFTAFGPG